MLCIGVTVFLKVVGPFLAFAAALKALTLPNEIGYQARMLTGLHGYTLAQPPPP